MPNTLQTGSLLADAAHLTASFRDFLDKHRTDFPALKLLSARSHRKPLTKPLLKELETALLAENPAFNQESLWAAYAALSPDKVTGPPAAASFADLAPLVRFALEQQSRLEPFAETTQARLTDWVARKHEMFPREQKVWLGMMGDHIGRALRITPEDLDRPPFSNRGGWKRAYRLFYKWLPRLLAELNEVLAA